MQKLMLFSHSGFSDTNANGITMKNLLSAWLPEEKAEFYCDVQPPDYTAAHRCFRVTDVQMLKAFLGKRERYEFAYSPNEEQSEVQTPKDTSVKSPRQIPAWLKKQKYNFALKWIREYLRILSPGWRKRLKCWLADFAPDVIVYMVGESIFMDKLVLKVCRETGKPLVLYNGEAYRIIDLKERKGLERLYYRKTEKLYARLNEHASLVIYNCEMLKNDYQVKYYPQVKSIVAYNSAACDIPPYEIEEGKVKITYFGNLGVGRSEVLLQVASILHRIDSSLVLDIYGRATKENAERFMCCPNICYHGFIDAERLREVIAESDILLHVESFDETIVHKLKYAFSTKIAHCLCSGRCFVSYAPIDTASSRYLSAVEGVILVSDSKGLQDELQNLISNPTLRLEYAQKAYAFGIKNHEVSSVARRIKDEIEMLNRT